MNNLCLFADECDSYHHGPAFTDGRNLCRECERGTARDIGLLVYDFVDLSQLTPRERTAPEVRIARARAGSQLPLSLRILTVRDNIVDLLTHWERVLATGAVTWRPSEPVRDGYAVQRAVGVVAPQVDRVAGVDLRAYPDQPTHLDVGVLGLLELRTLHRRAAAYTALTARVVGLPGECPDRTCRARRLTRREGGGTVSCGRCGGRWAYEDYQRYVTLRVSAIPLISDSDVDLHSNGGPRNPG